VLAGQRQQLIVEEVRRRGAVRVSELTALLRVSDMTVRRDLDVLATSGLVEKVHGGATAPGRPSVHEPGFEAKSHRQLDEKEAIARAAATLVAPGRAIGLTAGTTTWRLAHHLRDVPDLTVVTNSIRVADVLDRDPRPDRNVLLTGGVRTPSDALVGPVAVTTLQALHIDVLFLGVHGMDDEAGFTTPNLLEAETNQAFVTAAERLVVVADSTKWGVRGLCRIARLEDAEVLVTDAGLPTHAHSVLEQRVGRLVVGSTRVDNGRRRAARTTAGSAR
jgi:DeoR/GlpR family transcriptional regulator of sugar metabolism